MASRSLGWRRLWQALLCLFVLPASQTLASRPQWPERRDIFSPNRRFVVDVNPKAERFTVYSAADRHRPLWSFSRPDPPTLDWRNDYFLSNDGKALLLVNGVRLKEDELHYAFGIEFWT